MLDEAGEELGRVRRRSGWRRVGTLALSLCSAGLLMLGGSGCGSKKGGGVASASAEPATSTSATPGDAAPKEAGHTGKFVMALKAPEDKRLQPYHDQLDKSKRLHGVVEAMGVFALPRDVPVIATDAKACKDNTNAFYLPKEGAILLCYAFSEAIYKSFITKGDSDPTASAKTLNAITFLLIHEMGHALIQELGIGVTGKEEDAVDELSALILIQAKKSEWAITGPQAMVNITEKQDAEHPAYFDEHSLSPQRLADMACMVFGSDPENHPELAKMPELRPRLEKCEGFYKQKDAAWTKLLDPHYRK